MRFYQYKNKNRENEMKINGNEKSYLDNDDDEWMMIILVGIIQWTWN